MIGAIADPKKRLLAGKDAWPNCRPQNATSSRKKGFYHPRRVSPRGLEPTVRTHPPQKGGFSGIPCPTWLVLEVYASIIWTELMLRWAIAGSLGCSLQRILCTYRRTQSSNWKRKTCQDRLYVLEDSLLNMH